MMQDMSSVPHNNGQQVNSTSFIGGPLPLLGVNNLCRGLFELQDHCSSIYSNVEKPLCFHNKKSLILGTGTDPLEYIYIYKNEGNNEQTIPPHWHYIGFGLSDIHSYAILYELDRIQREKSSIYAATTQPLSDLYLKLGSTNPKLSGFGIELTFRIKCDSFDSSPDQQPPMWPIRVMQDLARYVFRSKLVFKVDDHVDWGRSLDGESDSRIEHILMTLDPQLQEKETTLGWVKFIQIVGVCQEEFEAARDYNTKGVLDIMKERSETGGQLLVTDMRRGMTIFEVDPENREIINEGILKYGSNTTSLTTEHKYSSSKPKWFKDVENLNQDNEELDQQEDDCLLPNMKTNYSHSVQGVERGSLSTKYSYDTQITKSQDNQFNETRVPSRMSLESESELTIDKAELLDIRFYDNLYLLLNSRSAKILPVALKGRLAHGQHFSYQTPSGELLTSFVPGGADIECLVSREQPFARKGTWLQIYVSDELRRQMLESLENISFQDFTTARNLSWPDYKFSITIVDEIIDEAMDTS